MIKQRFQDAKSKRQTMKFQMSVIRIRVKARQLPLIVQRYIVYFHSKSRLASFDHLRLRETAEVVVVHIKMMGSKRSNYFMLTFVFRQRKGMIFRNILHNLKQMT